MKPRVLIVDDHSMIRKGVKLLLSIHIDDLEIGEAVSCLDLMNELATTKYTHLILDITLSDGNTVELLPDIRRTNPDIKIMIFSMAPLSGFGMTFKKFGIEHFLPKTTPEDDAIRIFSRFVNDQPLNEDKGKEESINPFSSLTAREAEILQYIVKAMHTKEIAVALDLKMNTVSTVKNRIFAKTGTNNIIELLRLTRKFNY